MEYNDIKSGPPINIDNISLPEFKQQTQHLSGYIPEQMFKEEIRLQETPLTIDLDTNKIISENLPEAYSGLTETKKLIPIETLPGKEIYLIPAQISQTSNTQENPPTENIEKIPNTKIPPESFSATINKEIYISHKPENTIITTIKKPLNNRSVQTKPIASENQTDHIISPAQKNTSHIKRENLPTQKSTTENEILISSEKTASNTHIKSKFSSRTNNHKTASYLPPTARTAAALSFIGPELSTKETRGATSSQKPEIIRARIISIKAPNPTSVSANETKHDERNPETSIIKNKKTNNEKHTSLLNQTSPTSTKAVIIAETENKLPIISVRAPGQDTFATFIMPVSIYNASPGTEIEFTPVSTKTVTTEKKDIEASTYLLQQPAEYLTSQEWSAIEESSRIISSNTPQAAQSLAGTIPSPANPTQMGAAILFFLAAIRTGDIGSWLGEKSTEILKRDGKNSLLSRLSKEITDSGKKLNETAKQDWKGFSFPISWNNELHKATLHYRNQNERNDSDEQNDKKQTRFIIDIKFSKMGDVQIDGLLHGKRLDLALRTQQRISPSMQKEMRKLYTESIGQTGYEGEISFQNNPERWVRITTKKETSLNLSS